MLAYADARQLACVPIFAPSLSLPRFAREGMLWFVLYPRASDTPTAKMFLRALRCVASFCLAFSSNPRPLPVPPPLRKGRDACFVPYISASVRPVQGSLLSLRPSASLRSLFACSFRKTPNTAPLPSSTHAADTPPIPSASTGGTPARDRRRRLRSARDRLPAHRGPRSNSAAAP